MSLTNINTTIICNLINGQEKQSRDNAYFTVQSIFFKEFELRIPDSTLEDLNEAIISARNSFNVCQVLTFEERRKVLYRVSDSFSLSDDDIRILSALNGMPVRSQREKIEEGKALLKSIANHALIRLKERSNPPTHRITGVLVPPNDPREWFFFIANLVMSGIPAVIKASSREPFLGQRLIKAVIVQGYPNGGLNLLHFDTSNPLKKDYGRQIMSQVDLGLLMGDPANANSLIEGLNMSAQIYYADNSRAIIGNNTEIDKALEEHKKSLYWPGSCISSKHIYVVGDSKKVLHILRDIFIGLDMLKGDIMHPDTRLGRVSPEIWSSFVNLLENALLDGQIELVYPSTYADVLDTPGIPVLARSIGANSSCITPESELMKSPIPLFFTCVHEVHSLEGAIRHINASAESFPYTENSMRKSMAVSIYTSEMIEILPDKRLRLPDGKKIFVNAHDIHLNESTMHVQSKGTVHQGIDIIGFLHR